MHGRMHARTLAHTLVCSNTRLLARMLARLLARLYARMLARLHARVLTYFLCQYEGSFIGECQSGPEATAEKSATADGKILVIQEEKKRDEVGSMPGCLTSLTAISPHPQLWLLMLGRISQIF